MAERFQATSEAKLGPRFIAGQYRVVLVVQPVERDLVVGLLGKVMLNGLPNVEASRAFGLRAQRVEFVQDVVGQAE